MWPDLFDQRDVRGRPGQASRHRAGGAERRDPPYPPGRPARIAIENAKQNGGAAARVRRADRRGACGVWLKGERDGVIGESKGGMTRERISPFALKGAVTP